MEKLFFVPVGGLGNRMRAVASAVTLAQRKGAAVEIGWFRDWALNAPFSALFEHVDIPGVKINDISKLFYPVLDRPRRKNLFLPRLFQKYMFDECLYEEEMYRLYMEKTDFLLHPFQGKQVYMTSCYPFYPYRIELLKSLFQLNKELKFRLQERCAKFSAYTVGVHVRRTDHVVSIAESPLELFFDYLDKELNQIPSLKIFLATDSEEVKAQMRMRYGERVITSSSAADRNSVEGIREGLLDLYSLAATGRIYGSYGSSFSELAAELGNCPLTVVKK